MSIWDWFTTNFMGSTAFWLLVLLAVSGMSGASLPFVRQLRLWQSKRRFMAAQSAKLENPQNADVRFQLANLYAEGGGWRRAEEHAREAVRVARENPLYEGQVPYHYLLLWGQALYHRRRYAEAIEAFEGAIGAKAERGHPDAHFGLGKCLYREGRQERAIDAYRKTLEENQSILEVYFRLAQSSAILKREGDVEAARSEFWRVAASLPRFAGRRRFRWRAAFFFFPISRHLV